MSTERKKRQADRHTPPLMIILTIVVTQAKRSVTSKRSVRRLRDDSCMPATKPGWRCFNWVCRIRRGRGMKAGFDSGCTHNSLLTTTILPSCAYSTTMDGRSDLGHDLKPLSVPLLHALYYIHLTSLPAQSPKWSAALEPAPYVVLQRPGFSS